MKLKQLITGTLLIMSLLLSNTFTVLAANIAGHLDGISGDSISGWAWDNTSPDSSMEVTVTVTLNGADTPVREIKAAASSYRDDLVSEGKGTGNYGFQAVVHWNELESGTYKIQASANGKAFPNALIYDTETKSASQISGSAAAGSAKIIRSLGVFKTTAYCPCRSCSAGWGRQTSTGSVATTNHTVAVDPRVVPYGTKLMINGAIYTAEDKGGGVKGKHIDIFYNSHGEALQYGLRNVEVFLVQ